MSSRHPQSAQVHERAVRAWSRAAARPRPCGKCGEVVTPTEVVLGRTTVVWRCPRCDHELGGIVR
jgi:hypothetical protein